LHHPSVIKFYGVGQSADYVYMVTELCDGSLTNLVDRCNAQHPKPLPPTPQGAKEMSMIDAARARGGGRGRGGGCDRGAAAAHAAAVAMPLELLLSLAVGVARGVEFLHSRGVVHRDIKVCHILVERRSRETPGGSICVPLL
jgi:serine/threonine protein kinase